MRKWTEATALGTLLSNTKCKKRPDDLVTVARAMKHLVGLYGSQEDVATRAGLSTEMIRQFLAVLGLPRSVKVLFTKREIDSVDIAKELAALGDERKQVSVAKAIAGMPSKDVRDIKRLVRSEGVSVKRAKKAVLNAKAEELNVFILDFSGDTLENLLREAKARRKKPADLVREIVRQWLESRRGEKR